MNLTKIFAKYLGKPFKHGGKSPEGYDCLGFIAAAGYEMKKQFPTEFGDWNINNYHELYMKDHKAAEDMLINFLKTFGTEVNPKEILAGDLIVVQHEKGRRFPAWYVGNGNAIASFLKIGVHAFALNDKNYVIMARRV